MNTTAPGELPKHIAWRIKGGMTSKDQAPENGSDKAEEARKLIREFVETPPAKTMADVKAASEVYEANAREPVEAGTKEAKKPKP